MDLENRVRWMIDEQQIAVERAQLVKHEQIHHPADERESGKHRRHIGWICGQRRQEDRPSDSQRRNPNDAGRANADGDLDVTDKSQGLPMHTDVQIRQPQPAVRKGRRAVQQLMDGGNRQEEYRCDQDIRDREAIRAIPENPRQPQAQYHQRNAHAPRKEIRSQRAHRTCATLVRIIIGKAPRRTKGGCVPRLLPVQRLSITMPVRTAMLTSPRTRRR